MAKVAAINSDRAWVSGAGPTGCLAALALVKAGWQVILHDSSTSAELCSRSRAYALTNSSKKLLEQLDLWGELSPRCQAFKTLLLSDKSTAKTVRFWQNNQELGWIINHPALMDFLLAKCQQHQAIQMRLGEASSGINSDIQLTVLAEGPNSSGRKALGIGFYGWPYRQGCLTVQVELQQGNSHNETAWELFRPEGPLAVLPLGDGHAQVVWSAPLQQCRQRAALAAPALLEKLSQVLPSQIRPIAILDKPGAFAVEWRLAPKLVQGKVLLCGESAHRCHPVGGQGLNLCWRDVSTLLQEAKRQRQRGTGLALLLARYQQRRWFDLLSTMVATDALVRLFSNQQPLLRWFRSRVLELLKASGLLRKFSLKLASGAWTN